MGSSLSLTSQEHRRFVAEFLRTRTAEIAAAWAEAFDKQYPTAGHPSLSNSGERWRAKFEGRLLDLACAIDAGVVGVFASQVLWARAALAARNLPHHDLERGLQILKQYLPRELPPDDHDLVNQYIDGALEALSLPNDGEPPNISAKTSHGRLAANYLLKLLEGDRKGARRIVLDAVKGGLDVRTAYLDVLVPAQRELGRMWHIDEISIAEEHFATATTRSIMAQLLELAPAAQLHGRCVVVASVQGNMHDLGTWVLADFFELGGWRVIELGASLPAEELIRGVEEFRPDLLAISAAMPSQLISLGDTIALLRCKLGAACPKIMVGGMAFSHCKLAWKEIEADGYAANAQDALRAADELVPPFE